MSFQITGSVWTYQREARGLGLAAHPRHGRVRASILIQRMLDANRAIAKREAKARQRTPMFDTVDECMTYYRRRK